VQAILVKIAVNAVAIWIATLVIPGVRVSPQGEGLGTTLLTFVVIGALFGVVNAFIKPVVKLLAFPFYILTLGLIAFVVNALMLALVSWLSGKIGIAFTIDHFFWSAIGAAVVVTFVSMILNVLVPDSKE
jgi:putative membrane protein